MLAENWMSTNDNHLNEQLKARLFESISAQLDAIGYVPGDIARLVGGYRFEQRPSDPAVAPDLPDGAPTGGGNASELLATQVNRYYDATFYERDGPLARVFGDSDYRNIGYWDETTTTQHEASVRLQEALLAFIPEKTGRILDVACGLGISTRRLQSDFGADNVWAINISEKQIETTRENAPGCHAQVMNAVDLKFDDGFFDNIECIEAAFHFETRRRFLEEALRVLKPGGRLVLSDVLFTSPERLRQYDVFPSPANHLQTADEYRALLVEVGFREIVVQDVSREVWGGHFLYVVDHLHRAFLAGELDIVRLTDLLWTYYQLNAITGVCLFACARK